MNVWMYEWMNFGWLVWCCCLLNSGLNNAIIWLFCFSFCCISFIFYYCHYYFFTLLPLPFYLFLFVVKFLLTNICCNSLWYCLAKKKIKLNLKTTITSLKFPPFLGKKKQWTTKKQNKLLIEKLLKKIKLFCVFVFLDSHDFFINISFLMFNNFVINVGILWLFTLI